VNGGSIFANVVQLFVIDRRCRKCLDKVAELELVTNGGIDRLLQFGDLGERSRDLHRQPQLLFSVALSLLVHLGAEP
jgi:hypothetical protein